MKKNSIALIICTLAFLPLLKPSFLFDKLLQSNASWTLSFLSNWIVVFICGLIAGIILYKNLKGIQKYIFSLLVFLTPLGIYFAVNPIYEGDFRKKAITRDIDKNDILSDVLAYKKDFNGVVCVASNSCPYCVVAVRNHIRLLHSRNKAQDVLVFLSYGDETVIKEFREKTESSNVPIIVNTNAEGKIDLETAAIPAFIYIKKGKIVHQWRNDDMGYPALDWIESGLK